MPSACALRIISVATSLPYTDAILANGSPYVSIIFNLPFSATRAAIFASPSAIPSLKFSMNSAFFFRSSCELLPSGVLSISLIGVSSIAPMSGLLAAPPWLFFAVPPAVGCFRVLVSVAPALVAALPSPLIVRLPAEAMGTAEPETLLLAALPATFVVSESILFSDTISLSFRTDIR